MIIFVTCRSISLCFSSAAVNDVLSFAALAIVCHSGLTFHDLPSSATSLSFYLLLVHVHFYLSLSFSASATTVYWYSMTNKTRWLGVAGLKFQRFQGEVPLGCSAFYLYMNIINLPPTPHENTPCLHILLNPCFLQLVVAILDTLSTWLMSLRGKVVEDFHW